MSLKFYREQFVRECREKGISTFIHSCLQYPLKRFSYIFPATARYVTPKLSGVGIEPTNACNLHCKMCFSQRPVLYPLRKKGFMDFKLYKKIMDELSTFGYAVGLGLSFGGESLLHNRFIDMVDYATSMGFHVGFNTNGMLLSDEVIERLIDLKVDSISISLDGLGKVNDSIRLGSDYNVIENNILELVKMRGSRPKPEVDVLLTQCEQNHNDVWEFVNYWVDIVDNVRVSPCLSEDLRIINPTFFDEAPTKENIFCPASFDRLEVLWNGDVTTCCHDINGVNILGNVAKRSITEVWKSWNYRNLRYAAVTNTFSPESLCYKCNVWKIKFSPHYRLLGRIRVTYAGLCKRYNSETKKAV